MSSSFLLILVLVFSLGALLAAWAGIRSIQSARTVVFYRTRQARMMAGWQWLGFSVALVLFAGVAMAFGNSLLDRFLPSGIDPTSPPGSTLTLIPTSSQLNMNTGTAILTFTYTPEAVSATQTIVSPITSTIPATPSRTAAYVGTSTALAMQTQNRRSTFIAMLSSTPTASRTPIPTWTRTPSSTPRPTYTASPTRTPRPTVSLIPTHTLPPTWTASPTHTPRPTLTATTTRTVTPAP